MFNIEKSVLSCHFNLTLHCTYQTSSYTKMSILQFHTLNYTHLTSSCIVNVIYSSPYHRIFLFPIHLLRCATSLPVASALPPFYRRELDAAHPVVIALPIRAAAPCTAARLLDGGEHHDRRIYRTIDQQTTTHRLNCHVYTVIHTWILPYY